MALFNRHLGACLAVAALSVGVGACGSSSKTAAPSPSTGTATSTTAAPSGSPTSADATTTTSTGGSATAAPVAVCTTFPTAQIATLSGIVLDKSREQDAADENAYTCDYFTDSGVGGMSITITTVGGAAAYTNSLSTDTIEKTENVTPVSGLGDRAFSANDGLRAVFGDRLIYVAGVKTVPPAQAIIQAVQAKLG